PQSDLDRTANTQPALLTASIAALRAAEEAAGGLGEPVVVMGHSLGEFTALVAAGALPLAAAVVLVRRRGELMQDADPSGGMLAVIGLDADAIAKAIAATPFATLRYPVVANVDAQVHEHAADFASLLEKQVWSPVQWVACVRRARGEGATAFVEFGPGNVLTGLAKRILPDARTANVSDVKTLEEALTVLR